MNGLTVKLYQILPSTGMLAPVDEYENVSIQITKRLGVGDQSANVTLLDPPPDRSDSLPEKEGSAIAGLAHCEILWGTSVIFGGQVQKPHKSGGNIRSFLVRGYAGDEFKARKYDSSGSSSTYSSADLLTLVLGATFPWISTASGDYWQDPNVQWTLSTFDGQSIAEIVNQVLQTGGSDGYYYDFGVSNRTAWLRRRQCPQTTNGGYWPTYYVPNDDRVDITPDYATVWTDVDVEYQDTSDSTTKKAGNKTNITAMDHTGGRTREITLKAGQMSTAQATALRDAYLAKHAQPLRYGQIRRSWKFDNDGYPTGDGLELDRSNGMPVISVPVGDWVGVEGEDEPFWVDSWSWNSEGGTDNWTATLGDPDPDANQYRMLKTTHAAQMRLINPTSGSKAR